MEMAGTVIQPVAPASEIPEKSLWPGFSLPVYGLGTWGLGGTFSADHSDDQRCVEAIQQAIHLGVRHVDTAEMYGSGHAEELIGAAIRKFDRQRLIIGTKALAHHLSYHELILAAERSIDRMNCQYLDLYMIHHPSDEIPIAETMRGMDELRRRDLVRAIGVANFTKERLAFAQGCTKNKIAFNQVHYSLAVRQPERSGLVDYCRKNGVLLVAWQPIDRGVYKDRPCGELASVTAKYGITPLQAALSWVTSQPGIVAICRTSSVEHLQENVAATRVHMETDDIEHLRRSFEPQRECSQVYPLK
jgi:diketogulonate reductase-like aldo/keto reductase